MSIFEVISKGQYSWRELELHYIKSSFLWSLYFLYPFFPPSLPLPSPPLLLSFLFKHFFPLLLSGEIKMFGTFAIKPVLFFSYNRIDHLNALWRNRRKSKQICGYVYFPVVCIFRVMILKVLAKAWESTMVGLKSFYEKFSELKVHQALLAHEMMIFAIYI